MERLPHGRHHQSDPRPASSRSGGGTTRTPRTPRSRRPLISWTRAALVTGTIALASVVIPAGVAGAAPAAPAAGTPTLKATLAEANNLAHEIEALSEEYDSLRIQVTAAHKEAAIAREAAARDRKLMASGQAAIGQIAAEGYMNGAINPTLQMLQSSNPQQFLNQASIMLQLQQENGDKLSRVTSAEQAAKRASLIATQEEAQATKLTAAMTGKVSAIQAKEAELNTSAFAQAMVIFQQTGNYPAISVTGDSVEVQALRYALTRRGDAYVWAAAGPTTFDCSGLVVWAYAQLGISLPHYTGDIWNDGEHVSQAELQPGDLIFLYANLDHMGIYVGNGLYLNAPHTGTVVQVSPVPWGAYDGAVRIA
ncbi:MAG TPA: C40 family peptidase [Streptosporangiaceae bacterium]|nr:C40 family peptidase [Streptosporangiaceae bacterium]